MDSTLSIGNIPFETQVYILFFILLALLICCFSLLTVVAFKYRKLSKNIKNEDMTLVKDVIRKLIQKQKNLDDDIKQNNLEDKELSNKLQELNEKLIKNNDELLLLDKKQRKCFDKIKVVRYSVNPADEEVLSYSIGITNNEDCGIVITGIKQEDGGTDIQVKTIRNGVSKSNLSEEEKCSLSRISGMTEE